VLVLLFLAGGGPVGDEAMMGASTLAAVGTALDGPDISGGGPSCVDGRFLLRAPVGEPASGLRDESAVDGRGCGGEDSVGESRSGLSVRFDIGQYR
jgi:hypothetical protein